MLISNCESIRGERSLRLSLNVTSLFGVQYCSCIVIYEAKLTVRPDKELFGSWRSKYVDLDFHFELTGRIILQIDSVTSRLTIRRSVIQDKIR